MALNWEWKHPCGHLTLIQKHPDIDDREITYTLYRGNATLIALYEYKNSAGEDMYEMGWFFVDDEHMKSCLGLTKGHTNIFNKEWTQMVELVLNIDENEKAPKIAKSFRKAFSDQGFSIYVEY